jgi:hypothetical protein
MDSASLMNTSVLRQIVEGSTGSVAFFMLATVTKMHDMASEQRRLPYL